MKMYKVNFTGETVSQVITVPVDSEFLVGVSDGNPGTRVVLSLDGTPLEPMDDPIGNYTAFPFDTTNQQPSRKEYKAVLETEVEIPPTEVSGVYGIESSEENYSLGTTTIADLSAHESFSLYRFGLDDKFIAQGEYEFTSADPSTKDLIYLPVKTPEDTSVASGLPTHIRFLAYGEDPIEYIDSEMSFGDGTIAWLPAETATKEIPGGTKWVVTKKANLKVIVDDMSIAYRDLTGEEPPPVPVPYSPVKTLVSASSAAVAITPDNATTLWNTVYEVDGSGETDTQLIDIDADSFGDNLGNVLFQVQALWRNLPAGEVEVPPIMLRIQGTGIDISLDGSEYKIESPDGQTNILGYASDYLAGAKSVLVTLTVKYEGSNKVFAIAEVNGYNQA